MNTTLKNFLFILLGLVTGGLINGALVNIGYKIIPPPAGFDMNNKETFADAIKLFTAKNYIFPFLAHAIGTLVGAFIAAYFSATNKLTNALIVGGMFFLGGLSMVLMVTSPIWFIILDLAVAYFPMAFLGYKLASKKSLP